MSNVVLSVAISEWDKLDLQIPNSNETFEKIMFNFMRRMSNKIFPMKNQAYIVGIISKNKLSTHLLISFDRLKLRQFKRSFQYFIKLLLSSEMELSQALIFFSIVKTLGPKSKIFLCKVNMTYLNKEVLILPSVVF